MSALPTTLLAKQHMTVALFKQLGGVECGWLEEGGCFPADSVDPDGYLYPLDDKGVPHAKNSRDMQKGTYPFCTDRPGENHWGGDVRNSSKTALSYFGTLVDELYEVRSGSYFDPFESWACAGLVLRALGDDRFVKRLLGTE